MLTRQGACVDSGQPKLKRQKQTKKKKKRVKVSQILANHILTYQITVPHQKKKTKDAELVT